MKADTVVLTAYDDAMTPLGHITAPLMKRYAKRHSYDFMVHRQRPDEVPPLWWKLMLVKNTLEKCERVLWLDADMLITNPAIGIDDCSVGISLSKDWGVDAVEDGHFSCCGYVVYRDAIDVLEWAEYFTERFKTAPFGDQDALRFLFTTPLREQFHILQRRRFNAVPIEIHSSVVDPWNPADFAAHLTMVSVPERVALAQKILGTT